MTTTAAEPAEYDAIGDRYSEAKTAPFRLQLEAYTLERLAGDVRGARVLDLACGDGFYSRRIQRLGARELLGVDASAEMVALGERAERSEPLGCRYLHADVSDLGAVGEFDLVIASYLLNYAHSRDQLAQWCRTIAGNLRPGGRLVGVNDYTVDGNRGQRSFERHHFRKIGPDPYEEGRPITYEFLLPEGRTFAITNFYWKPATMLAALGEAGLRDAAWHPLELSPAGHSEYPPGTFDDLLAATPIAALSARR